MKNILIGFFLTLSILNATSKECLTAYEISVAPYDVGLDLHKKGKIKEAVGAYKAALHTTRYAEDICRHDAFELEGLVETRKIIINLIKKFE